MEWLVAEYFREKGWSVESKYLKANTHGCPSSLNNLLTKIIKSRKKELADPNNSLPELDYSVVQLKKIRRTNFSIGKDCKLYLSKKRSQINSFYLTQLIPLDLLRFNPKTAIFSEIKAIRYSPNPNMKLFFTARQIKTLREFSRIGIKSTVIFVSALPTPYFFEFEFKTLKPLLGSLNKLPKEYKKFEDSPECFPSHLHVSVPIYEIYIKYSHSLIKLNNREFKYHDNVSLEKAVQIFQKAYNPHKSMLKLVYK